MILFDSHFRLILVIQVTEILKGCGYFNWSAHSFPQVAQAAKLATLLHSVAQTQKVRKKLNLGIKKQEQIKTLGIMPE